MTRGMRAALLAGGAVVLALAVMGGRAWRRQTAARERAERLRLLYSDSATASLARAVAAMRGRDSVFAEALARKAVPRSSATAEESRVQRAVTSMPFATVHDRNVAALALVAGDLGTASAGTAFGVSDDGKLVTSRHVVQGAPAGPGGRVRVRYAGTSTWLPAHVVRTSDEADLALIQVDAPGRRPAVAGVSHNGLLARIGAPVTSIGFPHGAASPTMTAGLVSALGTDLLQITAYAGTGASGSPVFDARSELVGVVAGGSEPMVVAVPWDRVATFLNAPRK